MREVNQAPTLPVIATQTISASSLLTVSNTAVEPNIHSVTLGYGLINAPIGVSIDSNGIIIWLPQPSQAPSTNTITTIVTNNNPYDAVNPQLTATNSFTVIVTAPTQDFRITSIVASNGVATVTWNSISNKTYRLLYNDSLSNTNWLPAAPDVTATAASTSATNLLGGSTTRFYRVMLVTERAAARDPFDPGKQRGSKRIVEFRSRSCL